MAKFDEIPKFIENPFPYADTDAAIALQSALARAKSHAKKSLRQIAKQLNYKQAVVLSHMANGRIPIPVERAEEIATVLEMNTSSFLKMVLKQRFPKISLPFDDMHSLPANLSADVNLIGLSDSLSKATPSQLTIIRDVLRDHRPEERWLSTQEVFVVSEIRKLRPDVTRNGLSSMDLKQIQSALMKNPKTSI